MSFPTYTSYKDSDIAWLGDVPTDWCVRKFRHTFRESDEKIEREVVGPMLSVSGYRGVEIKAYDDENRRRSDDDLIGYRIVRPGQLVVNTMWLNYAGLGVSTHEGHVSPAYRAYWFNDKEAQPRFIHYLLRSQLYVQAYTQLLTGIRPNSLQMSREDLMNFPILFPPAAVQSAISAFLDDETAKIDALADQQRRLITLLKEKRQAVISQAVTKGLNHDVPMKDSGTDWLGEVPAHWKMMPIKRLIQLATSGPRGWSDFISDEGGLFFQSQNIGTQMNALLADCARINVPPGPDAERSRLRAQDLVVCITGARTGAVAVIDGLSENTYVNQHVCLIRPIRHKVSARYLAYCLFSEVGQKQLALAMYGLKQGLSLSDVREIVVGIPDLAEQNEIVAELDQQSEALDELENEMTRTLGLLAERRAALISAAVTGKIDVRGSAEVLLFPTSRARSRGLIAAEIIERLAHQTTFGRVKLQKIAYLAEAHVGIAELEGAYVREAAGPLDREMIRDMEREASALAGIRVEQPDGPGSAVVYRLGDRRGSSRQELAALLGDRTTMFDKLLNDIGTLDTKGAEAVATLYAVWNDALIDGETPPDLEIATAVLSEWHPEKSKKFRLDELQTWLDWMRRHGLVPTGSRPKTSTGRMFV